MSRKKKERSGSKVDRPSWDLKLLKLLKVVRRRVGRIKKKRDKGNKKDKKRNVESLTGRVKENN